MIYYSGKCAFIRFTRRYIIMRKSRFLIYMMLIMCLIFSGCGKDKKKENETTEAPATTQQVEATTEATDIRTDEEGFILANDFVKTKGETVNVRVEPNTDANIYVQLGNDEVIQRTGYNDEWTRVSIDNDSFYIYSEYVVKTNAPAGMEGVSMATPGDANKQLIVIDPGNQKNLNATMEEIGPGSEETKQSASPGFVGAKYGSREYELNLSIAYELKYELELRGYTVIMTREMDDVNISNQARAEVANNAYAAAFIRIQMNYSSNQELSGVMTICMPENSIYNGHLYQQSHNLSTRILQGITENVDVVNNGIYETNQMTAINWSRVPVTVVKVGYLSNAAEEELLMSYDYQSSIAVGIADGIDYYFGN